MKTAHINELGEKQSIKEHLYGTAKRAEQFADVFGCGEAGRLCGLLHDIGKYSGDFQRRIHDPEHVKKVDHSTAGAKVLYNRSKEYISLAMAVAGHHSGLMDGGNMKTAEAEDGTFFGRLKKEIPPCGEWEKEIPFEDVRMPVFWKEGKNPAFSMAFFIRMIYSCLVDADYLDTERFMSSGRIDRGNCSSSAELLKRFENYISGWIHRRDFDNERQRQICQKRTEILLDCMKKGEQLGRGLYSLTVPTGGGKTTASLGFALKQMQKYAMKRVIYVIPYTSVIDQTATVFCDILGEDNVLEHHSGIVYEVREGEGERNYRKALATENWDRPVVVTTAVQFFESLFAAKSSKCRKLHNIADSVIIFDEAQTLPVSYLEPCVAAISELAAHYKSTVVLCTATQPALGEMFQKYLKHIELREICDGVENTYQWFRRCGIRHAGILNMDRLCGELQGNEQVLCIVNRRRTAQEIYGCLKGEGTYCLTTLIYPAARKEKIKEIKKRLKEGLPCRVIATSLIEAGVDLDFPKVYRQEAGLDSVIQAAGRCNREGKRSAEESVVLIFQLEGSSAGFLSQNISALQWMQQQFDNLGDLKAISGYFHFYRELLGEKNLDVRDIMKSFAKGLNGSVFPFRSVAGQFRLIENEATVVYIPLEDGKALTDQLISGGFDRNTFRWLGQYGINVFPNHLKALQESGCLECLWDGIYILRDLTQYREDIGLLMDVETGDGFFV